jgi:hypothetical protein
MTRIQELPLLQRQQLQRNLEQVCDIDLRVRHQRTVIRMRNGNAQPQQFRHRTQKVGIARRSDGNRIDTFLSVWLSFLKCLFDCNKFSRSLVFARCMGLAIFG